MRLFAWLCAALLLPGCVVNPTNNGDSGSDGGGGGTACTGQQALCPGTPYGLCVGVQGNLGHCVSWQSVGASPCTNGPGDCPPSLPTGAFAIGSAGLSSAVCIKATTVELPASVPSLGQGYCAAEQTAIDFSGQATCTPDPCQGGFCSYVVGQTGASFVTCIWPI